MYHAMEEVAAQDLIDFPISTPLSGEMELEDGSRKMLTTEEKRALLEIDLLKEEVMSIQKYKTQAGNIIYKLPPSKERKMHDDRAYCLAMFGWHLYEKRRLEMTKVEIPKADYDTYLLRLKDQKSLRQQSPFQINKGEIPFNRKRSR